MLYILVAVIAIWLGVFIGRASILRRADGNMITEYTETGKRYNLEMDGDIYELDKKKSIVLKVVQSKEFVG